ncbi:WhiB family transcriptional regulator [Streptomyces sp. 796.1]|uniref:WhiB family transcriptional regulator n=1 Tax=Streptomyces sp. 796.1 TaxID=3163029 RepID=UPI0039C99E0D
MTTTAQAGATSAPAAGWPAAQMATLPATWTASAVCAQVDPELFFPEIGGSSAVTARRICAACPVRAECLAAALSEEGDCAPSYRHGIRGGLSPRARYALGRRRPAQKGASA